MVHCSKILLNIWFLIFLVMSIPFTIVAFLYYERRGFLTPRTCFVNNVWIPVAYGFITFFLSIIGMIASLLRVKLLQNICNWIVDVVIVLSLFITVYYLLALPRIPPLVAWANTYNNSVPWTVMYPPLLQTTLLSGGKWLQVQHCLNEIQLCDTVHKHKDVSRTPDATSSYTLLIQGCCYPPTRCGLSNSSEYQWEEPKTGPLSPPLHLPPSHDAECERWTKVGDGKCYGCDMCKASYLAKFHGDWKGISYFHLYFMFYILTISIFTGCGAFTELERDHNHR